MASALGAQPPGVRPRSAPGHRWWIDIVPALVVIAVAMVGTTHMEAEPGDRSIDGLAYALVASAGAVLLIRRRWPLPVLGIVVVAVGVYTGREYPGGPIYLAGGLALFAFVDANERRIAYAAGTVVAATMVVISVVARGRVELDDLLFPVWAVVAVLAADAMRGRRERALADAERQRHVDEHREDELRRRLAEDRLQIARDLHDSVAHSMASINVQSGVAAHILDRHPEQASAALEAIRIASRDVLDELGAMLDVLRDTEAAPHHPVPDLSRVDELVVSSRRAGLAVEIERHGDLSTVPTVVASAAYRIVQEALTNVIRHAGAARATVRLATGVAGGLEVEVVDDGRPTTAPVAGDRSSTTAGSGMGLVGIRERAAMTGGVCDIGPRPGGGYRVHVSWPGDS